MLGISGSSWWFDIISGLAFELTRPEGSRRMAYGRMALHEISQSASLLILPRMNGSMGRMAGAFWIVWLKGEG